MRRIVTGGVTAVTALALSLALTGAPANAGGGKTVSALGQSFSPKTVEIKRGGKVTWKNVQGSHTVTMRNGSFSKPLSGSGSVSKTFKKVGKFGYYCIPHESQGMVGKVVVKN